MIHESIVSNIMLFVDEIYSFLCSLGDIFLSFSIKQVNNISTHSDTRPFGWQHIASFESDVK